MMPAVDAGATSVVYIAGYGRSGSTLLDLLLGRIDGWFSMGEFRLFWHAVRDRWQCGCGAEVPKCPVWSNVLRGMPSADIADVIADARATLRIRRVPGLVASPLLGAHREEHDRLQQSLADTYRAAARTTGARVLVDSSKDPIYGLVLCGVPDLRVHVVHLVRDSRAVAWSWQRKRRRPEIASAEAYMPTRSATRTSLDWDLRNGLTHVLGTRAESYTRLTYEAFARDPDAAVEGVLRAVGAHAADWRDTRSAPGVNHTVAGNPMRFAPAGASITPDLEWRDALDARDRRLVTALTFPLLWRYGYR